MSTTKRARVHQVDNYARTVSSRTAKTPVCIVSNGRGSQKTYDIGLTNLKLEYDREFDPDYPWCFARTDANGRVRSDIVMCFATQRDAMSALLNGEPLFESER